jgi:polyphenol oxidase
MLEIISSDAVSARHGFFTRKGGASSGIFAGLNCGTGSTDLAEAVQINRNRVASSMAVKQADLVTMHQVHSADVVVVHAALAEKPRADGMVTAKPGILLGVLTADCQPVLFHDPVARVIGAAHAGWRGAKDGVLEATVAAMEAVGAKRGAIRAAIGPSISQSAYEVSAAFMQEFLDDDPANARFFTQADGKRPHFDLPGYGISRLQAAGIRHVEWTGHCTYSDPTRFFSYRRATHFGEADYGRLISVIRL